ncbi:MAG: hypothetical protein IJW64_01570 [Clostridia bacterium]|nr:hypothetical protein [Clostridia bacterium]
MKKKSIVMLLAAFTLSLVFGLVGCTTVSEGEGVKLSNETTFSLIKDKNDAEYLLDKMSNYHVVYNFEEGETAGYRADYFYSVTDGNLSADYSLVDAEEKVLAATNVRDGFSYTLNADGSCVLGVYTEALTKKQILEIGTISFEDQVLVSGVLFDGETLSFSTSEGDEDLAGMAYDWVVDYETLLIQSLVRTTTDEEGNVVEKATVTFGYDEEDFEPNLTAYETITDPNAEQVSLTVLFNPDGQSYEYEKTYTVALGTNIVFNPSESGDAYLLYENAACTRDIENVGEYLEYYRDLTVFAAKGRPQFSFDFTLTDADVEEMQAYIELFVQMIEENYSISDIESVRAAIEDKMAYFVHMYYMGQIKYYSNMADAENQEAFVYAQTTYYNMYDAYIEAYKAVYEMEDTVEYKQYFFDGWTEEDFAIFEQDNQAIAELEEANAQLELEYNKLVYGSDGYSEQVEVIYEQFVANNQKIAELNGYDNAYDYLSETSYDRYYSEEERAAFCQYLEKYIVPMFTWASNGFIDLMEKQADLDEVYNFLDASIDLKTDKYLNGYIDSFDNSLKQKMKNMSEKSAALFVQSSLSAGTAFANYSSYYDEAFTFFGSGYQGLLTVVHEMGHYISFDSYSLSNMGYDLAETHSQGNEWLMLYYLRDKMDRQIFYNRLLFYRLASGFQTVVYSAFVDAFEYAVYTAKTPVKAGEFAQLMKDVARGFGIYSTWEKYYDYALRVIISSPIYYMNYATSEIASMGFYAIAEQQGYAVAQEVYRRLQEDCNIYKPYGQILQDIGLNSPFEEQTYIDLQESFFPEY